MQTPTINTRIIRYNFKHRGLKVLIGIKGHLKCTIVVFRTSNSPSLRRRTDEEGKKVDSDLRRRSNLDVPRVHASSTQPDAARKSEAMAQCLALNVPGKTNIVAPWDGRDAV